MDINFANAVFPRRYFIASIQFFFLFFEQTWLVVISVKKYLSDFHKFLYFPIYSS